MPSGPAHLHRRFGDDWTAWMYLKRRGFTHVRFILKPPYRGHVLTKGESDAIDYLWMEWDWAYAPTTAPETPPEGSLVRRALRRLLRASSGPLRVRDKHLRSYQMWWYCVAKYEIRRRWYYVTGRRSEWDDGYPLTGLAGALFDQRDKSLEQRCPSCGGLNTSCPEGCGRDPKTGELDGSTLRL